MPLSWLLPCEDLDNVNNIKQRTLLAFLPGAGVFYCAKDWLRKHEGVEGSQIALDMSWFCLSRSMNCSPSLFNSHLQFGEDVYVTRFLNITSVGLPATSTMVSTWSFLYYPGATTRLQREVFMSRQCAEHECLRMPRDIIASHDMANGQSLTEPTNEMPTQM